MTPAHLRFLLFGGGALFFLFFFASAFKSQKVITTVSSTTYAAKSLRSRISDITNATLGFEKIFVLSMPGRYDKRDALSMSASVSELDFEWLDGVDGASMSPKSKPPKLQDALKRSNTTLGCWRAHMNAMQRIVKDRIQSAIIMEDDADWDVNVRKQLLEFAEGAKFLQGSEDIATTSPYGDDWDALWLGHCGINGATEDQRFYVIRDDPTAVPPELFNWNRFPDLTPKPLNGTFTRVVHRAKGGRCLFAYAVSQRGARRFLHTETVSLEESLPSDWGMARLCAAPRFNATCVAPYPAIFGSHKSAGPTSKDSDRQDIEDDWRRVGETNHIVFSVRLNLERLIGVGEDMSGDNMNIKSQWPDKTLIKQINGELEYPKGEGMWIRKEDYITSL